MTEPACRLSNYLTDELDDCTESDVDRRIDELTALAEDSGDDIPADTEVFAALANETRYALLRALDSAERSSVSVNSTWSSTPASRRSARASHSWSKPGCSRDERTANGGNTGRRPEQVPYLRPSTA